MFECFWIFWISVSLSYIGVAYCDYMSCLSAPEEQQLEEEDYDYTEELRDDQAIDAMSHPTL